MRSRRQMRGASAVLAVLLLLAFTASVLATWHTVEDFERRRLLDAETGRVFAMWLGIAHRATMRNDYRAALASDPDGFAVGPSALPGAPPGLRVPAGLTLGVMPDGNGVPMAWAVLTLDAAARADARSGAFAAGLADVAVAGSAGAMAAREAGVAAARGTPIPAGSLFATADLAIAYDDDALYRREQPGRPWANRMETGLAMGSNGIEDGGEIEGRTAETSRNVAAGGKGSVDGDASGAGLTVEELVGGAVSAASMRVTDELAAGSVRIAGRLDAGSAAMRERLDAGSLSTVGAVDAALLVVGGTLSLTDVAGVSPPNAETVTSGGGFAAREFTVTGALEAATTATVTGTASVGTLTAGSAGANDITITGAAFGPYATVSGTMTVGSCDGC